VKTQNGPRFSSTTPSSSKSVFRKLLTGHFDAQRFCTSTALSDRSVSFQALAKFDAIIMNNRTTSPAFDDREIARFSDPSSLSRENVSAASFSPPANGSADFRHQLGKEFDSPGSPSNLMALSFSRWVA
jgi:hypothetical protein